ncbi:MAG TPA: 4Fe-4S dicluster domain-containing protein [Ruminiclostridium sp.]
MSKVDYAKLKRQGYINQNNKEYFTVRARIQAGNISSEQMLLISEIAKNYGRGYVGLTIRLGIEIPWVRLEDLENVKVELQKVGLAPGGTGPTVRPIVACKGSICSHGLGGTQEVCKLLDEQFFGKEVGSKFKIGIVGCPNNCAKAQLNDLGFMGQCYPKTVGSLCVECGKCVYSCKMKAIELTDGKVQIDILKCAKCGDCTKVCPSGAITVDKQGFVPYIGGKFGRKYRIGDRMEIVLAEDQVTEFTGKILDFYIQNANKGERLGDLVSRVGMELIKSDLGLK